MTEERVRQIVREELARLRDPAAAHREAQRRREPVPVPPMRVVYP